MLRLAGSTGLSTKMRIPLIGRGRRLSAEAAAPKDVTSSLNRRLMRVLRDVKTPAVSKLIDQRKGYARKRRDGQASAGSSKAAQQAMSEVDMMHTLHEALRRYDEGVRAGLELHNQKTVSLLVTACSLPGSLWADEQLPRALGLFERTWSAEPIDPRARLDRRPDSVQVRDGSEPHGDAAAPASLPPVLPRCAHPGCGEVAAYGSAVTGFCRSCARHRDPSEVRVELDNMALNVLSESCVRRGGMLEYGAPRTRCTCTHARAACPASRPCTCPAHAAPTPRPRRAHAAPTPRTRRAHAACRAQGACVRCRRAAAPVPARAAVPARRALRLGARLRRGPRAAGDDAAPSYP